MMVSKKNSDNKLVISYSSCWKGSFMYSLTCFGDDDVALIALIDWHNKPRCLHKLSR